MKKLAFAFVAISLGISLIGCNKDDKSSNLKGKANLFDEINEKIDVAQKSLGSLASSAASERSIKRDGGPNQGHTEEDPWYFYEPTDVPSFVNKQQQMIYIISIVNYVREHLLDKSYGEEFKYDTLYEGAGFMETLGSLNQPIRLYGGPSPVLQLRYSHGENWLGFESNWDYQSDLLSSAYDGFWNIKILSKVKFVFDSKQKIKQIWVNYSFVGGLAFGCSTCLFDYENEYFYSYFVGNSNGSLITFTDPSMILDGYNKVNSGDATSDNLVFCTNVEAEKAKLNVNASAHDYEGYRRWVNRIDASDLSGYPDYSEEGNRDAFERLYDSVYGELKGFTLLTEYTGEAEVRIDDLINDSANYAFWRSIFVYDSVNNCTYIPFLEREELIKYMSDLKGTNGGDFDADLDKILASQQAGKEKYIGNYFVDGENTYVLTLADDATQIWEDNLITYSCEGGFTYKLMKNGELLLYFMIENGSAILVSE